MNIGIETQRAGLRLTIHRGGVGNRPNRLSASAPVADGETILSGMVMTLARNSVTGRNEWIRGFVEETSGGETLFSQPNTYYLAVDDSTDGDVTTAGSLQGLSVRGDYEVSISQFAEDTYQVGDALTPDGNTGLLKKTTTPGDTVIAYVVKDYDGPVDLGASFTDLKPEDSDGSTSGFQGNISPGVQGGTYIRPRETNAQDLRRLRIELVPPTPYPA